MSDIDWRIWLFNKLRDSADVTELVPIKSIYGAGSLTGIPSLKPFLVIRVGDEITPLPGVSRTDATIWAHDDVGNYLTIDDLLQRVRNALCGRNEITGQVPVARAIAARWIGNGPDQSDPTYGTLMKVSNYTLLARNGNA